MWKQYNTYKLLVIRQNDNEVSVDGMDVHAADKPYSILCIFIQGIYSDMLLNYINNMSLFKNFNYEMLHLWWTRSGEVGSVEMGCWPMRGGGVLTPPPPWPPRRSATVHYQSLINSLVCHTWYFHICEHSLFPDMLKQPFQFPCFLHIHTCIWLWEHDQKAQIHVDGLSIVTPWNVCSGWSC